MIVRINIAQGFVGENEARGLSKRNVCVHARECVRRECFPSLEARYMNFVHLCTKFELTF